MRVLLWGILLLVSCASSEESFSARLNRWVGATPQMLVENWGMPDNGQTMAPGVQIYTYVLRSEKGPKQAYPDEFAYSAVEGPDLGPDPNADPVYYCRISFIVRGGVITSYNFNGDACHGDILPAD